MKSTGITRRIDELGRIVIPKEIRKMLRIRDGENLEIFIDEKRIILQKHLVMENLVELSAKITEIFSSIDDDKFVITDREKVIYASNPYEHLLNQKISLELLKYIDNREYISSNESSKLNFEHVDLFGYFCICPIINNTDCLGLVVLIKPDSSISKEDIKMCKIIAKMLAEKVSLN